jgi:Tol biopolymer transport system component
MRLDVITPPTDDPWSMTISPDGRRLVFAATVDGKTQLWLRTLDTVRSQPLAGTEGASGPFWSPDSRSIGFIADRKLKRVEATGGPVQTLTDMRTAAGATWNADGVILFTPQLAGPIHRISAAGGVPAPVTHMEQGQTNHLHAQFLPDGRHFLYFAAGNNADVTGVYAASLEMPEQARRLVAAESAAVYAPPGFLLFVRQGTLVAQSFDARRLTLAGDPLPLAERALVEVGRSRPAASAAANGVLAFGAGTSALRQLTWTDRTGASRGVQGPSDPTLSAAALSADGSHAAAMRVVDGSADIWTFETGSDRVRRITAGPTADLAPVWSPDGQRLIFSRNAKGMFDLYETPAGGSPATPFFTTPEGKLATDWSLDGRFVAYHTPDPKTLLDIWAVPVQGDRTPVEVRRTPFNDVQGQFAPNGRWMAYVSDESGQNEVYVQPFPGPGESMPVSTAGGVQPRWRRDGRELFYLGADGRLMAVAIASTSNDSSLQVGSPVPLFAPRIAGGPTVPTNGTANYAVTADGTRFLINTLVGDGTYPITVVLNWVPGRMK